MLDIYPTLLGVYLFIHISMLKKYHGDDNLFCLYSVLRDENLSYEEEPSAILE